MRTVCWQGVFAFSRNGKNIKLDSSSSMARVDYECSAHCLVSRNRWMEITSDLNVRRRSCSGCCCHAALLLMLLPTFTPDPNSWSCSAALVTSIFCSFSPIVPPVLLLPLLMMTDLNCYICCHISHICSCPYPCCPTPAAAIRCCWYIYIYIYPSYHSYYILYIYYRKFWEYWIIYLYYICVWNIGYINFDMKVS